MKELRVKEKPSRTEKNSCIFSIFNKCIQVKMNFKDGLKGEENSWRVFIEAERSHPTPLTQETPGVYRLIILHVNFAWWRHLLLLFYSPLWVTARKTPWSLWNTRSLACCTPLQALPYRVPVVTLLQVSLQEYSTHCPQRRKWQPSQVFDCRHLLEVQGSISCMENKPFLGIKNSYHIL